ncbi:MAG TPA: ABC transporter permease [Streptosporangiaceae bacterium]|jgi:peptide/nickel transport system permease protein|nr:ABC transporter permease [Streptosporangiaceae bacterium]
MQPPDDAAVAGAAGVAPVGVIPPGAAPSGGEVTTHGAPGNLALHDFLHNKRAMGGCGVVLLLILFCFVGPLIYRTNQTTVNLGLSNQPPGPGNPLGTDEYGIDILGRLMVGGQSSLELGFSVAIASTVIGALYGAISGMIGGFVDAFLMRIVDTLLAVPTFILLLIVSSMFTLNLTAIIVILTVLSWPYVCRLVRAQVLSLRTREFVQASTAMGSTRLRILVRHMLPNTFNIFIVTTTFAVADSIYALSALSFLGLGPPPPFADWGTMLTTGVNDLFDSYPWEVYPALIILVVTILAFRQIGDALNDIASSRSSVR